MSTELVAPHDGVALARSVRAIATRARRNLKYPADPGESRQLLEAIDSLEAASKERASHDLTRWLSSLRERVETHGRKHV